MRVYRWHKLYVVFFKRANRTSINVYELFVEELLTICVCGYQSVMK